MRRFPRPIRSPGALGLPLLLLIVAVQVLINYHTGLISDPDHLYFRRGLEHHPLPYIDARIEYPVLTGVFMTGVAALTHGLQDFLRLNSVLLGACALGCTATLWSISRRAACMFALSPLLLVYSLANWDLFAILLMLLGWRCYLSRRYASAGAWLALGVCAKLFPIFLLGGCLIALIKRRHTAEHPAAGADLVRFSAAAAAATAAVNLPFAVPAFHNWLWFWTFNQRRDGQADLLSWLHILNNASVASTNHVLTALVLIAVIAGAIAIWRGTPVARVAALVFLAFMLLNKIYSPQYTLWVATYAILADWPLWTMVALTLIGLIDDASAAVHITLVHDHSTEPLNWFNRTISPREQGLRLLGSTVLGVAMLVRELRSGRHDRSRASQPPTGVGTDVGGPGAPRAEDPTDASLIVQ